MVNSHPPPGRAGARREGETLIRSWPRDGARTSPTGRYNGPSMTLGNMRENGVRTLDAWCLGRDCHHHRTLDVDAMPDDLRSVDRPATAMRALRPPRCRRTAEVVGVSGAGRMAPQVVVMLLYYFARDRVNRAVRPTAG